MSDSYIHPSPEQIEALSNLDLDGPVVMLNLLRFAPDGGAGRGNGDRARRLG
jgi:hypothetical protein